MPSVMIAFWLLGGLAVFGILLGIARYRTPLNPLSIFVIIQTGLMTILSGWIAYSRLGLAPYGPEDVIRTLLIAGLFLLGAIVAYWVPIQLLRRAYGAVLRGLNLTAHTIASRFSPLKFSFLLLGALVAFGTLAVVGGGGILWLTTPRQAYLHFRSGAGLFFILSQWFVTFAYVYLIWSRRLKGPGLFFSTLVFIVLISFMGSKNNILTLLIIALAYYNFYVRRIRLATYLLILPFLFTFILTLLVVQGSFRSLSGAVAYFVDYVDSTAKFMARFDEFGFQLGRGWISSFWFYVPRALYRDKPYEYGLTLIHKVLFPNAASLGHTPGILPWSLSYLDFGVLGVFLNGFFTALLQRVAYEYFLSHKNHFFTFFFMLHLSLWPVMAFASTTILVIWSVAQAIFLRSTLGDATSRGARIGRSPV